MEERPEKCSHVVSTQRQERGKPKAVPVVSGEGFGTLAKDSVQQLVA
jgi:hypothetical protein